MDKLTAIKIKYDDGTYSDEIPVSVLSENVEWDGTHTLVDVLGSIDVDVTGTIQDQISQLFNEKVSSSDLQSYISSSMPTYITNWLNTNVNPVGSAVVVDSSLTISGAAADAKVVGNLKNTLGKFQIEPSRLKGVDFEGNLLNDVYCRVLPSKYVWTVTTTSEMKMANNNNLDVYVVPVKSNKIYTMTSTTWWVLVDKDYNTVVGCGENGTSMTSLNTETYPNAAYLYCSMPKTGTIYFTESNTSEMSGSIEWLKIKSKNIDDSIKFNASTLKQAVNQGNIIPFIGAEIITGKFAWGAVGSRVHLDNNNNLKYSVVPVQSGKTYYFPATLWWALTDENDITVYGCGSSGTNRLSVDTTDYPTAAKLYVSFNLNEINPYITESSIDFEWTLDGLKRDIVPSRDIPDSSIELTKLNGVKPAGNFIPYFCADIDENNGNYVYGVVGEQLHIVHHPSNTTLSYWGFNVKPNTIYYFNQTPWWGLVDTHGIVVAGGGLNGTNIVSSIDTTDYEDASMLYFSTNLPDNAYFSEGKISMIRGFTIDGLVTDKKLNIILPKDYKLVVGDTFELFHRNTILSHNRSQFLCNLTGNYGNNYERKFIWTPSTSNVGTHAFTMDVKNEYGESVGSGTFNLIVSRKATSPSTMKSVLCVGDSLTASGQWPHEAFRRLCGTDGTPSGEGLNNIQFIGTRQRTDAPACGYEGYGGWTYDRYNGTGSASGDEMWITVSSHDKTEAADQHSTYTDANGTPWKLETIETNRIKIIRQSGSTALPASGTLTHSSGGVHTANIVYSASQPAANNPFYNEASGEVDFAWYGQNLGVSKVDYVYVLLGWNSTGDTKEAYKAKASIFINNVHTAWPDCQIILMGIQNVSADGFAVNGLYWKYYNQMAKIFSFNEAMMELENELSYVSYLDLAGQFDSEYNMPTNTRAVNTRNSTTETYYSNDCHPKTEGYNQIADAVYRDLTWRLNN